MNTQCSKCGMHLAMPWSFCPHCGSGVRRETGQKLASVAPEHSSASGGFGGLLFGVLVAPVLVIVGTLLCLTGLGAFLGVPMIIAAVVAPLAGPLLGMNAHKGNCPWCGTAVSSMADPESYDCPTCNKKFAIRDHRTVEAA